jgi:N4-gp56 family major capsid protein
MKKIIHLLLSLVMSLFGVMTFNLQAFANELQTTTSDGLSAEMKTFYDMTLLDHAGPALVHEQFGQKRPIPAHGGKIIEFRKFSPLPKATEPLTEGVTPDGKTLNVETITAEIAQYGDYITQSDVLELTALDNTILEATKLLGRQAGVTLDTVVRNVLHEGTNVSYCPKVVDGVETEVTSRSNITEGCQLTVDVVMQVVAKLRAQNAPTINGKYVAIIHPYVAYDLMRDPEWIDAHKYSSAENLFEGEIGEIAGVRFVQTTEAKIFENGVFATLFMGADAYGVTEITGGGLQTIVKQKGSAGTADPLDQRSSVGWKAIRTAEILIENYLVRVESYSNRFSKSVQPN